MLGAVSPDSFDTLHSYTNTFQMPFVTPWFPEKVKPPSSGLIDHAVSLRPDYHKGVIDTITYYGWKTVIYMYDSHDAGACLHLAYSNGTFVHIPLRTNKVLTAFLSLDHHPDPDLSRAMVAQSGKRPLLTQEMRVRIPALTCTNEFF
ncbi:unnamed protein product [Plutella xylostella]|uniref:(diamondback moth) hypothetical protein n=1 Tax=Plutella xylostella TaxID=51655 RepID=A0A8S4G642_PLUXY|nr:unnamed protein product [Plutella xylostella]